MNEAEIYVALVEVERVCPPGNDGEILYVIGLNQPDVSSIGSRWFGSASFL